MGPGALAWAVCPGAALWIWAKSEIWLIQRYISALWVGVECNSGVWRWIWMKFGGVHGECALVLPCENELNRRGSKNSCFWGEHKNVCNSDEWWWILIKFGRGYGECMQMLPCKYELNRRGSRFGSDSKVYKCSLSWKLLVTWTSGNGFWSNLEECMVSVLWYCPVKMNSIGGGLRFGSDSKVYKCSLSRLEFQMWIFALWVGNRL